MDQFHGRRSELKQEIFSKIFILFQDPNYLEIIENLRAWITTLAKNYCKDFLKKTDRDVLSKTKPIIDNLSDKKDHTLPEEILIRKDFPFLKKYEEHIKFKLRSGLEISLEWIDALYMLKKKVIKDYRPIFNTLKILSDTKENIRYAIGPLKKEEAKKYFYPNPVLKKTECKIDISKVAEFKSELDADTLKNLKVAIHFGLQSLIEGTRKVINANPSFNRLLGGSKWFSSVLEDSPFPQDILVNLLKLRIKPHKLMFMVWRKELIKGNKYADLESIEIALLGLREKTRRTKLEYLFYGMKDPLNVYNLRKSIYNKSKNIKAYEKLSDFIHKKSFIERISY